MTKNYIPYYYAALFYKIFGDEKDVSFLMIKSQEINTKQRNLIWIYMLN